MAETLDEAIREAKVAAGLDPEQRYPAYEFCYFLDEAWAQPFWERSLDIVAGQLGLNDPAEREDDRG